MKISSTDTVCEMYDASADWYSEMMDSEINHPIYADTLSRLHTKIESNPGVFIDTACGSGHMLSMYHERYDHNRPLFGIDLSPQMVTIASKRLGSSAKLAVGDMRELKLIENDSAVAVLNFFALHHLDFDEVLVAFKEWHRVLQPGGELVIATWEGKGAIDYGEESDITAVRYLGDEVESLVRRAGFIVSRCVVEPVDGFPMDAIYLEGIKE